MEIDLTNLPADIAALKLKGDIRKLFKLLYMKCSKVNNVNSNEEDDACQLTIIIPTGERLLFELTSTGIKLIPGGEIEMDVGEKQGNIYLAHVKKTNRISGKIATNYAITIASLLGAKTLSISDSAYIKCNDGVNTFPLSLYRVLTSPDEPSIGWYENVAKLRGYSANNRLALKLGFSAAVKSARDLTIDEINNYLKQAKPLFEMDGVIKQKNLALDYGGGLIEHEPSLIEDKYKKQIIDLLDNILQRLSLSKSSTLGQFLNEPDCSCIDKSILLRSLPGFNSHLISVPMIICDKDDAVILEFPHLKDFLIIKTVTLGYKIKLKGGRSMKKNRTHALYTRKV
jgi:hypothetical protein